jgi:hypothetical protein
LVVSPDAVRGWGTLFFILYFSNTTFPMGTGSGRGLPHLAAVARDFGCGFRGRGFGAKGCSTSQSTPLFGLRAPSLMSPFSSTGRSIRFQHTTAAPSGCFGLKARVQGLKGSHHVRLVSQPEEVLAPYKARGPAAAAGGFISLLSRGDRRSRCLLGHLAAARYNK